MQFAQKAFVYHAGRVLVVRKASTDPEQPGRWDVPGGRKLFREDLDDHVCREVREETGVDVAPGEPFHMWQWVMADGTVEVVAVARECSLVHDAALSVAEQVEEDHIAEAAWVPLGDLLALDLIPSLRPAAELFVARCAHQMQSRAVGTM
jgi:8-oxo-dGTP pyrophosphatase MutT (NUDIX family)